MQQQLQFAITTAGAKKTCSMDDGETLVNEFVGEIKRYTLL